MLLTCLLACADILFELSNIGDKFDQTMLDEASKHVREAIMLGRTDIVKKLLEEVKTSLIKGNVSKITHKHYLCLL